MDQDLSNSSKEELIKKITELEDDLKRTKKYGLVWDKEKNPEAVVEACKTKIPVLNEDTSKRIILGQNDNLLIEGDNFHSLTALNFILANSIDVIYIDPPYNTGHGDFIYNDNYVNADDGFRHSKWLSFMAKRLELARNLLTNRGAIYMSIDDREVFNLKLLCDSIFGEKNFICCFVKEGSGGKQDSVTYSVKHEYLLCYSKNAQAFIPNREKKHRDKKEFKFFDKAKNMYYKTQLLRKWGDQDRREDRPNLYYPLFINKKGLISTKEEENSQAYFPVNSLKQEGRWRWAKNSMQDNIDNGLVEYKKQNGEIIFYEKIFYDETDVLSKPFSTIISNVDKRGIEEISSIFGDKVFSYPKSVDYLKYIIGLFPSDCNTVLDFFAGSGTTGQAVMELNKEDGGHRRFILCTNNENSICETITYPRLKTVMSGFRKDGSKYGDGIKANLFYFKTDFVNDSKNRDQAKYSLVEKCNGLLSILEDCFILKDKATNYFEYSDCGDKRMFIYNDFYSKKPFDEMKEKIKKETGKKILYIFSTDDDLSPFDLSDLTDVEVKPIPTKIYEIYKEIVEDIKRGE